MIYEPATYTASSVVAKYIDTEDNTIRPDDVYNGDDGDSFSIKPAYIKVYSFLKIASDASEEEVSLMTAGEETGETEVPGLVEGVFQPQMLQIITYVYKQITNTVFRTST